MVPQPQTYIGIDPGVHGGIACIRDGKIAAVAIESLTLSGMWEWFRKFLAQPAMYDKVAFTQESWGYGVVPSPQLYRVEDSGRPKIPAFAVIEKVGGFMGGETESTVAGDPTKKRKNIASGHTMFTFGSSFGALRMCLVAAEIPYEEVLPKTWQRGLAIPSRTKKEDRVQYKRRLKEVAQALFPRQVITLATSDAILIAEFNRRKREGIL
jgi:hypothetical protein